MEVHVLIVKFVLASRCFRTQRQVKAELPELAQLHHLDITFFIGMPIDAKLTITRL